MSPVDGSAVLLIPKRWLRFTPWINVDPYFSGGYVSGPDAPTDRVAVLHYNRHNYGLIEAFIHQREALASECTPDPIFRPMSITSAKRRLSALKRLPTGKENNADKKYEDAAGALLASALYPHLDFAADQVRTDSGAQIRDIIFYNTRTWDFLTDAYTLYDSRQLVFELKNVQEISRDHVNQLNRYLTDQFGRLGVLVTRHPVSRAIEQNLVDLWSGQRRCILVLTDEDLDLMVTLLESGQRKPIEVLKRAYVTFSRRFPG